VKVLQAIKDERFYVLPLPEYKDAIRSRMEDILQERDPGLSLPAQAARG
jgi:hypothetical protein